MVSPYIWVNVLSLKMRQSQIGGNSSAVSSPELVFVKHLQPRVSEQVRSRLGVIIRMTRGWGVWACYSASGSSSKKPHPPPQGGDERRKKKRIFWNIFFCQHPLCLGGSLPKFIKYNSENSLIVVAFLLKALRITRTKQPLTVSCFQWWELSECGSRFW